MGRQGKNTHNITKSNTTPVKSRDPTTERVEQLNIDGAEENGLKNNFREYLKEEMRDSLKEMVEKTNKKLEDLSKSF